MEFKVEKHPERLETNYILTVNEDEMAAFIKIENIIYDIHPMDDNVHEIDTLEGILAGIFAKKVRDGLRD
jgi:hypothetical protein